MRIVHLAEELSVGGLPNYLLRLAKLQKEKWPASVTVAHMGETVGASLETDGLDIIHIRSADDLRKLSPGVVHVHLLSDLEMLSGLRSLDARLVRSFHDYTSTCLRRGKRRWPGDRCQRALGSGCAANGCLIGPPLPGSRMPRLMNLPAKLRECADYRKFHASIAGSRHMQNMLLKNGFDESRVRMVPYFSRFADEALLPVKKPPGAGKDRPLEMLFSGQAVRGKGLEVLVDALAGVQGNWRLTVFSEGPRLQPAKERAEKHGIAGKIEFHGWVGQSALKDAYRAADLFVLPSIWDDPGPLVGIEAMAFATPVAGFAVGGIPDYVIEGKTGFPVTNVSTTGLREVLQSCMNDPGRLTALGSAAQKLVAERHSPEVHLSGIAAAYDFFDANGGFGNSKYSFIQKGTGT